MNNFDGFISIMELSWLKKPPHPSKIVQIKDKIKEGIQSGIKKHLSF